MLVATGSQDKKWSIELRTYDDGTAETIAYYGPRRVVSFQATKEEVPDLIRRTRKFVATEDLAEVP